MSRTTPLLGLVLGILATLALTPMATARASTGLGALATAAHLSATNANESANQAVTHQRTVVENLRNTLGSSSALTSESRHLAYYEKQKKALAKLEQQIDELEQRIEDSACE